MDGTNMKGSFARTFWARKRIALTRAVRSPAVWAISVAIFFLPAVVVRVLSSAGGSSQTSEILQTGVRLLALTFVLPFNGN
jgi:hypothetical protein